MMLLFLLFIFYKRENNYKSVMWLTYDHMTWSTICNVDFDVGFRIHIGSSQRKIQPETQSHIIV